MTRLAVVGSREFKHLEYVVDLVERCKPDTIILSGGARGVDRVAERVARKRGLQVEVFPADWDRYGKKAGMLRNESIVSACDHLIAFWDGGSTGTIHSCDVAFLKGKLYCVCLESGIRLKPEDYMAYRAVVTKITGRGFPPTPVYPQTPIGL